MFNTSFSFAIANIMKRKSLFLVLFQALITGVFLSCIFATNPSGGFSLPKAIVACEAALILFYAIWVLYTRAIFMFIVRYVSYPRLLRLDSVSYMPLTVSLLAAIILYFFNAHMQVLYSIAAFGLLSTILFKVAQIFILFKDAEYITGQNRSLAKGYGLGFDAGEALDGLRFVEPKEPFLMYQIDGEFRNSINLKNLKNGKISIKRMPGNNVLDYSIGFEASGKRLSGNLKLYILHHNKRELIFNKDAINILNGWNAYKAFLPDTESDVEILWENSVATDIYLSVFNHKAVSEKKAKKNIIVIVLDGVLPQTIGLYRKEPNADNISRFFKDSIAFEDAYVQGEWTLPNFVSIATSLYSQHHNVNDPNLYFRKMPSDAPTLAEMLQGAGYNTFGYTSHKRVAPEHGHCRGYNRFIHRCTSNEDLHTHMDITLNAVKFLRDNENTNNFLFMHYFDTHAPFYQSPGNISGTIDSLYNKELNPIFNKESLADDDFEYLRYLYNQKYEEVDKGLALLFDYISKYEKDNTSILLTSDHGISMLDSDIKNMKVPGKNGKEYALCNSVLRVPFMLHTPNGIDDTVYNRKEKRLIEANLSIMPTLLDMAGVSSPDNIDGVSVLNIANKKDYAISESNYMSKYELKITTNKWSYFVSSSRNRSLCKISSDTCKEFFTGPEDEIINDKDSVRSIRESAAVILKKNRLWCASPCSETAIPNKEAAPVKEFAKQL